MKVTSSEVAFLGFIKMTDNLENKVKKDADELLSIFSNESIDNLKFSAENFKDLKHNIKSLKKTIFKNMIVTCSSIVLSLYSTNFFYCLHRLELIDKTSIESQNAYLKLENYKLENETFKNNDSIKNKNFVEGEKNRLRGLYFYHRFKYDTSLLKAPSYYSNLYNPLFFIYNEIYEHFLNKPSLKDDKFNSE